MNYLNTRIISTNSPYVRAFMWQAGGNDLNNVHLYEIAKPTISQVRCHIFAPNGDYARYEKYCVDDYGQLACRWIEKPIRNTSIWTKYANELDSVITDLNSNYVRYDSNNYYFDFYHDPHQGRPDLPFPNKEEE
jgi:coproporphyrinogen III oxidase